MLKQVTRAFTFSSGWQAWALVVEHRGRLLRLAVTCECALPASSVECHVRLHLQAASAHGLSMVTFSFRRTWSGQDEPATSWSEGELLSSFLLFSPSFYHVLDFVFYFF